MVKTDQLVCLALLVSRCVSLAQPWSRSPYKHSDSTDLHIEKSGIVTHSSGEGLSLNDRGVYKVKSRQSRYRSVYRISKDPPEGGTVGADLLDEDGEFVNFRQASQAELVRYMKEKNRALWAVLAEVMNQEPAEYASGKGPLPSPYNQRRRSSPDRQTLIIPVKVLLNFPNSDQTGRSGPSGSSGTTRNLWSQAGDSLGWKSWHGGNEGNVKDPLRGLRGGLLWTVNPDTIPIAREGPPDDVRPGTDPRSAPRTSQRGGENRNGNTGTSTSPWADGGRDRGTDLSPGTNQRRNKGTNRDPRTNQGRNQYTNLDPRTNQGRNQGTSIDPRTNQETNIDPWTNPRRSQGTNIDSRTNQGRNQETNIDPRANQDRSQGTNIDPRTNLRRSQGTNIDLRTNQGKNIGTNIDPRTNSGRSQGTNIDLGTNQGRNQAISKDPWTNQGRNQGTSRDPWTNQSRNQGASRDPWTNQGRNLGTSRDPWTNQGRNQRTNTDTWTTQTKNSGTNQYPRSNQIRNQGTNTDPQRNQGRYQGTNTDSWTNQTRNRGTNTGPRTNQGINQRTSTDPWTNHGTSQKTNTDPRTDQTRNQGTNTDQWTTQIRNQGTNADPWTNQRRNQGTNTDPWANQRRNQGTNTDPWANQRRNQGTNTDPWANQGRNLGTNTDARTNQTRNQGTNSVPWTNQGRNQGMNTEPWVNQRRNQGTSTDPRTNQGRNQGTNTDIRTNQTRNQGTNTGPWTNHGRNRGINTDARINQGRNRETDPDPWRNQGRNKKTSRYSVGNERRIPGTNRYSLANEGGNQRTNQYPSSNQNSNSGTSTYPSANERQTPGTSRYPSANETRNLGIHVYLLTNQGPNQGTNTESRGNQGRNQEGYTDIRTNQVGNQRTSTDPPGNQTRSSQTNRSPWANDGQNGRTHAEPWPNQGRNQWTNSDPSTNPRGLQGTSTDPENDSNVSTETNTDPWVNQGRNPGSIADQTINSNLNSFSSTRQTQATGTSTDRSAGYLRNVSNPGRSSNLSGNTVTSTGRRLNRNTVINTARRLNRNTQSNTGRRLNRNPSGESGPWPKNSDQNPNAGLRVNPTASSYLPTDQSENQTTRTEEINNRNQNHNDRFPERYAQTQNDYGKPNIKSASVKLKTQNKSTRKLSRVLNSTSPSQEPNSQNQHQNQNALSPVQNRSRKALSQDEKAEPAPSQNQSQRAQSNYSHALSQSQSDDPSPTFAQNNDTRELNPFGPRVALRQTTPAVPLSTATPDRKSGSPFRPPAGDMRRRHNSYVSHKKPNVRNNSTKTSKNQQRKSDLRPSGMQNQRRQHRDKAILKPVMSSFDTKPPSRRKRDVGEDARRWSLQPDLWPPGVVSTEVEAAARDHERSLRDGFLLRSSSASSKVLPFSTHGLRSPPASSVAGTSSKDVFMTPPQALHHSASAQSFASSEPYASDVDRIVPVSRAASTGYSSWSPYSPPRSFYKPGSRGGGYRYGGGRGGGGRGGGRWGFRGQVGTGLNSYHAIVKNGLTALLQISNSSSSKGTTSKARGGNADLSGSYFLYDPVTDRLSLISGSRTNGVTSQVGTEGSYFEYSPSTEELKLVTNNKELFHFFTNNSNSNSNKQNGNTSNKKNNGNKNKNKNTSNINNNLKGSYLQYNPLTGELVLKTESRVNPGKRRRSNPTHPGLQKTTSASPFSPPGNVQVVGVIRVDRHGGTRTPDNINKNPGYIQFDPESPQAPNAHAIESIQIVIEKDNSNSYGNTNSNHNSNTNSYSSGNKVKNSQNSQDQQIVGFVIVDGGTASFVNPNTGGYIQFNPAGTGTGQVWRGGGGPKRWSSSGWTGGPFYPQKGGHPVPSRPLVRPDPGLFLRMFREGEIYLERDAVVQNFYTDGDSKRMMRHFRSLPLKSVQARNGFMSGNIKGYHVTACSACGPGRQPMIEFITLYVTSPRLVRRFLYLPRRSGGWVSSSGLYAAPPRHQPRYLGTSPFRNRAQFGIPPFRNQMFDDFAAKRQKRNFARKRRD